MRKNQTKYIIAIASLAIIVLAHALLGQNGAGSSDAKKASAATKAPVIKEPLNTLSDKDLLKYGKQYKDAGDLDKAKELLEMGLEKRNPKHDPKKDDKEYTPMLKQVSESLADREAARGESFCRQDDLPACEKQIGAAKQFATTPAVTHLKTTFDGKVNDLKDKVAAAQKQAASGNYDGALSSLKALNKPNYIAYIPNLNAEVERTTNAYKSKLLGDASKAIDEKNWDAASNAYQHVLDMDRNNSSATSGLNVIAKAKRAYGFRDQALVESRAKRFEQAIRMIDQANELYPTGDFDTAKAAVTRDWVTDLTRDAETRAAATDFNGSRDAYLRLDKAKELDPDNAVAKKYMSDVADNFTTAILSKAAEDKDIVDYSKIGTAYLLEVEASRRSPGSVDPAAIKAIAAPFKNKRFTQIVLSVENTASTASATNYVPPLQQRTRQVLEGLVPQDVRICEERKCVTEDAQFDGVRQDNKSRVAIFTVSISKYEFSQQAGDTQNVQSKYNSGIEKIANPEWVSKKNELERVRAALDKNPKKDKPTVPEGWTESTYNRLRNELDLIDKDLSRDKITDYSYSRTPYTQRTTVEINLELRDYTTKNIIKTDRITYTNTLKDEEIEGVRDTDASGNLRNKRLRLPTRDDAFDTAANSIRDQLDTKIQSMLPAYTDRFFNEGVRREMTSPDEAVEAYICHYAFMKNKMPAAQLDRVTKFVKEETGFDLKREGDWFLSSLD